MCAFREKYGAGRAIAAPQIGVRKRMVYMNTGEPVVLLNDEGNGQTLIRHKK